MSTYSHCQIRHASFGGTGAKPSPTYIPVGVGGTVDGASSRRFAKVAVTDTLGGAVETPGGVADTPGGVADTPGRVADTPGRVADTPSGVTNGPELVLGPAAGDMGSNGPPVLTTGIAPQGLHSVALYPSLRNTGRIPINRCSINQCTLSPPPS